MDNPRDVQTSKRSGSSKSLLSDGSAVAMEIKRKKIRQSALFLQTENTDIQEKLDFEMRMREGAYKLLLACSKREQVLNASKNLLTCNARIKAYLTQLQREKEGHDMMATDKRLADGRLPCHGTIAVTGLRLPLMWRDSDHFNNRGSSRRVAVFCLMQIGSDVFDTEMVVVDRSITDICFDGVTLFKNVDPEFDLRVELWSCALEEELTLVNTPKKLAKKLRNSFGKNSGKKLCTLLDTPDPDTFLHNNPIPPGAKYSLLAYTTLGLPDADGSFQSHSLIVYQNADWSSWLPLYGNLCCRFVAQPACMTQSMMCGYLSQKQTVEGVNRCCSLYCVLSAGSLSCYFTPEEIDAKVRPALNVPINQETRIHVVDKKSAGHKSKTLSIINPSSDGSQTIIFTADTRNELEDWLDALHQHLYDQNQWLHCCDRLMKIEVASPRKPSLFLTKQADSVYNDLSITSPVLVEKSVLSPSKTSTSCSRPNLNNSSTPLSNKRRRAPQPPSDIKPHTPPTRPARPPLPAPLHPHPLPLNKEKENSGSCVSCPATRSRTGRPSLDAKFSSIIQQLQRNNAGGAAALSRRNAPLAVVDVHSQGPPQPSLQESEYQSHDSQTLQDTTDQGFVRAFAGSGPVPPPRSKLRKSFRERMNLKAL